MSILGNRVLGGAGQQPYTVGRSLRFRSSATAYLNRTPSVTGSRQKFTWSAWVKRGILTTGTYYQLFGAGPGAGGNEGIFFDTTAGGLYLTNDGPSTAIITSAVFRDPSAWYHIVCAVDTTQATAANRQIFYINGVQQTSYTGSYCAQNTNFTYINVSGVQHRMGAHTNSGYYFDGYMAEINYVDGQQLTPSSFGFYDNNGVWQPRKYGGTYGTNGFYLPFSINTTSTYAGSFNGSNQYLSMADNAAFDLSNGEFTVEAWVLRTASGGATARNVMNQSNSGAGSNSSFYFGAGDDGVALYLSTSGSSWTNFIQTGVPIALNQWNHVVWQRRSNTLEIYLNGTLQTVTSGTAAFSGTVFNSSRNVEIGTQNNAACWFAGQISNLRYVKGTALYSTNFTPSTSPLTAVSGTQLLTLQNASIVDNSANAFTITNNNSVTTSVQYPFSLSSAISNDASGNGNNWTANNISLNNGITYDSMIDSPTVSASSSNYCVLNPLTQGNSSCVNGNLTLNYNSGGSTLSTFGVSSGKWYYETTLTTQVSDQQVVGMTTNGFAVSGPIGADAYSWGIIIQSNVSNGQAYHNNAVTSTLTTYTAGDVAMVAFDVTAGKIWFGKNGTWLSSGDPANGTNPIYTDLVAPVYPALTNRVTAGGVLNANFGQRPFAYTPPSGFNALNTYNLPQPTIMNGAKYMAATTYTGNGSTLSVANSANNTTGVVFQPDFVWQKNRSSSSNNILVDSVRGGSAYLISNTTGAELPATNYMTFNTNGETFTSSSVDTNQNGQSYIAWQWNAGSGVTSTNTNGTISSLVSVNPSAGFSISAWTSNGVVGSTIGHGLGVAPNFMIVKPRASAVDWVVYHSSIGATGYLILNTTAASVTSSAAWNNVAPTSTVFTVGNGAAVNPTSSTMIGYFWSAVAGYSAFGSYTGNGSADGPFIYTGFRPRFIIVKRTTLTTFGDWETRDTSRDPYNYSASARLFPNSSAAEDSSGFPFDILSNGFKIRSTGVNSNESSQPYIYAAFAENPFKVSRAR